MHTVKDVHVYGSLSRVSTTGGDRRERQGNRVCSVHEVLDGLGNQKGKGVIVVITANPLAIVRVTRPIILNPKTAIEWGDAHIIISHETYSAIVGSYQ